MELTTAKAILNEAISGGFLDDLPSEDEEIFDLAENFAKHAKKEYNEGQGANNDTIVAIVNLSQEPVNSPSFAQQDNGGGSGSSAFFRGMPLPKSDGQEPAVEMPFDISEMNDAEIRRYHGIFNHYFGRARYELANQSAALTAAEHLRDNAFRKALAKVDKRDKTIKVVESEAMEDSEYQSWNNNALEHEQNVLKLKALAEIYSKNVEALSREATIRQNEFERGR